MAKRIAYLGPPGTFTEEAALLHDKTAQFIPFPSIPAVAVAVASGMAEEGVVAIENSIEGSVTDTLDLLIHESGVLIKKELVLPIEHHLLVKPGTEASEVKVLYSHPQALAQCRQFIERCFPRVEVVAALSTAAAVEEMMASQHPAAAIGTRRAAQIYGAQTLAQGIQDQASNVTRFVVLAATDHPPTGFDKTSLCFSFAEDHPGILCSVLQEFAQRDINLAKVESRPSKESLGKYIFLIDLEGHHDDPPVSEALEQVRQETSLFKLFGSYPRYGVK
ncbi:MAG: prephenate dehydratase [Dehalococcoidia bacterium]|nr:prephenate dehydratase [Dehalococcoidia bacterium]